MTSMPPLAFLGAGKMGEALIAGLIESGTSRRDRIHVADVRRERTDALRKRYGVRPARSNGEAVSRADVVVLSVKPSVVRDVILEVREALRDRQLVISIAAGVGLEAIQTVLGRHLPVVRAMPNTPCLVREGMTAICAGPHAGMRHLETARRLFEAVGRCVIVEERLMNAVTALSGSGPAFQFVMLDALADGGVKSGLPRDLAVELAAQTMRGAAVMALRTGEHPGRLKDAVATPGGCTVEGLLAMEEGRLRATLIQAVVRTARRAGELAGD